MKKVTSILSVAAMALVLGFTACESKTAQNVEDTAESAASDLEAEADSAFTDTDTISVRDTPVNDGVADKVENQ
jgi:PBP1b-binding outer membrane lipoprotein LpoB